MNIALLGRTRTLLRAADVLLAEGHSIGLVWTRDPEPFYGVGEEEFAALARRCGAVFRVGAGISSPEGLAVLRSSGCALAVSVNWPTILNQPVRESFPLGILNCHAGDLPRYRGNACPNWAIIAGESQMGLCVHLMEDALDAGPVVRRDLLALTAETYIEDVYAWIEERTPVLLAEAVSALAAGETPQAQSTDSSLSLRCYPRRPEDARIQWSWPVERIHRLIRASSRPFDGAFAFLEGERKVTVWRARPVTRPHPHLAVPGQVCFAEGGNPVIACGDGLLCLTDLDLEGAATENAKAAILGSLRNRLT